MYGSHSDKFRLGKKNRMHLNLRDTYPRCLILSFFHKQNRVVK